LVKQALEEITQLVDLGDYFEAETNLSKLKEEYLPIKDKIIIKILRYRISIGLYRYLETLKDIDLTINVIKQNGMVKELFQILYIKSFALQFSNKFDESLGCVKEGIEILEKISIEKQLLYSMEYAYLLLQKGYIYFIRLKHKEALTVAKKAQQLFEESEFLIGVGETFTLLGLINYSQGYYPEAIEFINEGLIIFEDLKVNHQMLNSYYYLGRLYYHKGQIRQALSYSDKMLHLVWKYNDDYRIGIFLLTSSILYAEIGKYKLAKKNALESLKHLDKISRNDISYLNYYRLFIIAISQNLISEAEKYLEILHTQKEKFSENTNLFDIVRLAEAQLEMKKNTSQGNNNAKLILNDVYINEVNRKETAMEARYYLCNILLQEYLDSGKKELLDNLNRLTTEILEFGKKGDLIGYRVKANHLRLLAVWVQQLHSSQTPKKTKVEELLLDVQLIAEKHSLSTITKQFTAQQEKLLQQKQTLEDFIKAYYLSSNLDSFNL